MVALSSCTLPERFYPYDSSYIRAPLSRGYEVIDVDGDLQADVVVHYETIPCPSVTKPCDTVARVIFAADDLVPFTEDFVRAKTLDPFYRAQLSRYLAAHLATEIK